MSWSCSTNTHVRRSSIRRRQRSRNPLLADPNGFRERCRRRIEDRRTWVLVEQDQLIFKADVISDTPEVVYLEGVYVHPEHRGKGHGSKCLTQLTRSLLNE